MKRLNKLKLLHEPPQCAIRILISVTQLSEIIFYEINSREVKSEANLDQYQYLGNCPPTPPLTLTCYQWTVVEVGEG